MVKKEKDCKNCDNCKKYQEQAFELDGFDSDTMYLSNPKGKNAGDYTVSVSLKNNHYIWEDQTTDMVIYQFKIEKATPNYQYQASDNTVEYDGKKHGISLKVTAPVNTKVKYMDEDGLYTLDAMPTYKEVGVYTIYFKLYIDDNYAELYDFKQLSGVKYEN